MSARVFETVKGKTRSQLFKPQGVTQKISGRYAYKVFLQKVSVSLVVSWQRSFRMSNPVTDHYENHLAPIYSWMVGDFEAACSAADDFYAEIDLPAGDGRIAVDLGCGHGVHSIPIARRGYRVICLDSSKQLLSELDSVTGDLPIQTVQADLTDFPAHLDTAATSLITCMGDTLTHLLSCDAVDQLIRDAARSLRPDGLFIISFRDYATHELTGSERFIPVRSDDRRIHTCFLEYREDAVLVHDIIHSLGDSTWHTSVSAYPKLRLHPDRVVTTAESSGLAVVHRSVNRGMLYLAFKPSPIADAR
ncbi:class I SAM-dependent methyltransferase [Leptothoe sp. EHU-05/26/07-4]